MKTYFALHCITARNVDDNTFDNELEKLGYNEEKLPESERPTKIDIAQGQIDEPLIEKGRKQAEFIAKQINDKGIEIKKIFCADQLRCKETAVIIANHISSDCEIIVDPRINAKNYGIIAEEGMETDKLKHFWRYKMDARTLKIIAFYLLAPEKIKAEKKSDFKARINSFLMDKKEELDGALIVAGSDMWKEIENQNYHYAYDDEQNSKLKRGQLAFVNFEMQKEKNLQNVVDPQEPALDEEAENKQERELEKTEVKSQRRQENDNEILFVK